MNLPAPQQPTNSGMSGEALSRRLFERYSDPLDLRIRLVSRPGGAELPALVHDISRGGIGLIFSQDLPLGSIVTIDLGPLGQGTPGLHLARVIHTERRAEGGWFIGCEFAHSLSGDIVPASAPVRVDNPAS